MHAIGILILVCDGALAAVIVAAQRGRRWFW